MFPTFSGNSRRLRNVNLSGQRHTNPFNAHSLSPGTGAGTSKTIANAQAERKQRQQERDELKAARSIQRTWRGHQTRQAVRARRREALAELYDTEYPLPPEQRIPLAFPLLIAASDIREAENIRLLSLFAADVAHKDYEALVSGQLLQTRLRRLVRILVLTLGQKHNRIDSPLPVFDLLIHVIRLWPSTVFGNLRPYFKMLAEFYNKDTNTLGNNTAEYLQQAVAVVLTPTEAMPAGFLQRAYSEFAESFLTKPLSLLEDSATTLSSQIDFERLSQVVIDSCSTSAHEPRLSSEELLWLLAHTVDLQNKLHGAGQGSPLYLKALHTLLSLLTNDIRLRFSNTNDSTEDSDGERSRQNKYLETHIRSLVDKGQITQLLERFTASQAISSEQDYSSLLAGYAIVLLQCFPDKSDDIRMRFYLADLPTRSGPQPAVLFFWEASKATTVFREVLRSPKSTLDLLVQRNSAILPESGSVWDMEWRTILLFLELYAFILKYTDDDDFFSAFPSMISPFRETKRQPMSRLRSSALSLPSLETLTLFLKNLSFTLLHNASNLLRTDSDSAVQPAFASTVPKRSNQVGNYYVVRGLDFHTFRTIVTTAIQMLYERDSRRKFLPDNHWHMTSNFDMAQFVPAVVSEEQRQNDLQIAGLEGDDDDMDMDSEEDAEEQLSFLTSRASSHTSRYASYERIRQQRERSQRERLLATIGPKLEILRNMPYILPFEKRVQIFRHFVHLDKVRRRKGLTDPDAWRASMMARHDNWDQADGRTNISRHSARIRRDSIFESALSQFWELGEGLKEPIQITFIDDFGNEEAGIDGGGVTKEFLTCALMEILSPEEEVFQANKENAIFPNPRRFDQARRNLQKHGITEGSEEWNMQMTSMMKHYEFIGRMIGKCLYEGILIDFVFAGFFLLKWSLSATNSVYRANINDLREMDEELYQGMMQLKNYDGDVADLDLDFTIEDQVSFNNEPLKTETRNLTPNGDKLRVTNENRPLYISYVARHRLMAQPRLVTAAFLRGLNTIIDPMWLRMFNQNELQRLVGGDSMEIDVDDLRRNTVYGGLYVIGDDHEEHPTVKMFWDVVESLHDDDRRLLLKYVTSTPRAPLLGFAQLTPRFSIRDAGNDESRLPSTSTCVNLLKLPRYSTEKTLREKLLYAIRSNARFDLS